MDHKYKDKNSNYNKTSREKQLKNLYYLEVGKNYSKQEKCKPHKKNKGKLDLIKI